MRDQLGCGVGRCLGDALERSIEDHEIGRIHIGWQSGLISLQDLALGADGDVDNSEHLPVVKGSLSIGKRIGPESDLDSLVRIKGLHEFATDCRIIMVDHRDWDVTYELPEIGLRVVDAIHERSKNKEAEHAS